MLSRKLLSRSLPGIISSTRRMAYGVDTMYKIGVGALLGWVAYDTFAKRKESPKQIIGYCVNSIKSLMKSNNSVDDKKIEDGSVCQKNSKEI